MSRTKKLKRLFSTDKRSDTAILMYHQIRAATCDPWETSVSPEHFQQQMEVIYSDYQVHPFSDLKEIRSQAGCKRKLLITFDDGYLDNYTLALPLLRKYQFPATFYIPTQILEGERFFWWEALDYLFWISKIRPEEWMPAITEKYLPDMHYRPLDGRNPALEEHWSANTMAPPTEFCRLYLQISAYIKNLPPDEQKIITGQLAAFDPNSIAYLNKNCAKMSDAQLKGLFNEGFELGAHSIHHPALGMQDLAVQRHEISQSKVQLETLTGGRITTFAYPHGHYSKTTQSIVEKAGFTAACTTAGGVVTPKAGLLNLPRIWVKDWDAATFKKQLDLHFTYKK